MKAAAVVFKRKDFIELDSYDSFLLKAEGWLGLCRRHNINVVVFPALLGCLFKDCGRYISDFIELSNRYKGMAICPGSFYEREAGGEIYHSSCIILDGNVIMKQRQVYLAKWERNIGLSRGIELNSVSIGGIRTGIIVSTDAFYPQVSRAAAMSGVELVLSPVAIIGAGNMPGQLAGLWQNVQSNLFFCVESGFKGNFKNLEFYSRSIIHAPLEMTEKESGFMAFEGNAHGTPIIAAVLDNEKRREAVKKFNPLGQLNIEAYKDMFPVCGTGGCHD